MPNGSVLVRFKVEIESLYLSRAFFYHYVPRFNLSLICLFGARQQEGLAAALQTAEQERRKHQESVRAGEKLQSNIQQLEMALDQANR